MLAIPNHTSHGYSSMKKVLQPSPEAQCKGPGIRGMLARCGDGVACAVLPGARLFKDFLGSSNQMSFPTPLESLTFKLRFDTTQLFDQFHVVNLKERLVGLD